MGGECGIVDSNRTAKWPSYVMLTVVAVVVLIPIAWMLMGSIEPMRDMFSHHIFPTRLELGNYIKAFRAQPFAHYMFNSVFTTGTIVVCQLTTSALAAYGIVFTLVRGRYVVFALVLLSLMIPIQAIFIPDYVLLSDLHWINSYEALIVPFIGTGFGIFYLRQAFMAIPRPLVESMQMDGASHWTILRRLVLPNSKASLVTLALLNGVFHYGYLFWPLLVTNTPQFWVVPVGLSYYSSAEGQNITWNLLMAANVIAILPVIAVFAWGQRHIAKGVLAYAIKG
jgi:ABC-type glycerol-3-phosphate transport system permease component